METEVEVYRKTKALGPLRFPRTRVATLEETDVHVDMRTRWQAAHGRTVKDFSVVGGPGVSGWAGKWEDPAQPQNCALFLVTYLWASSHGIWQQ